MLITYAAMQGGKLRKRAVECSLVVYVTARVITSADIRTTVSHFNFAYVVEKRIPKIVICPSVSYVCVTSTVSICILHTYFIYISYNNRGSVKNITSTVFIFFYVTYIF
jgi:hypothetical protein